MSKIPDCRTNDGYNEKYLDEAESVCVTGYDFCIEDNIKNFFNNASNYENDIAYALGIPDDGNMEIDEDILSSKEEIYDYTDEEIRKMGAPTAILLVLKQCMLEWAECNRNELITSMIDNMEDKEYEILKAKVNTGEYKNAIIRQRQYQADYDAGKLPTCWTFETDGDGNPVKVGHCPNGNKVIEKV